MEWGGKIMREFRNKVAIVTGAASGIGYALCEVFAEQGMKIVLADIERDALEAAAQRIRTDTGVEAITVPTDVSKAEVVEALAEAALHAYGAIDIACNNAGVFTAGATWECTEADYRWLLDVNLMGVVHGIRSFIPRMIAQDTDCHLLNTVSMAAVTAMPFAGVYHMTKHAVLGLSECLYHELNFLAPKVKVSVLCPELVNTAISNAERNRPPALAQAGDIPDTPMRNMTMQAITDNTKRGVAPRVLAERALQGIKEQRFYLLSDEEWRKASLTRLEDLRLGRNPTFEPPLPKTQ